MDQGAVILLSLKGLRLIDLNDMKWNVEIPFRRLILLIGKETNLHTYQYPDLIAFRL